MLVATANDAEINTALEELLQQKSIPAHKINLGLAYYGYSYILEDESCSKPGCPAKSVGKAGPCSKSKGTLYDSEIENIIDQKNPKQHVDKDAAIAYFTYDDKNWYVCLLVWLALDGICILTG